MSKEPKAATMLAARLARAYPSLSAYSAATLAEELCAIERAQRRHAERCCSGEDGGYVKSRPASGQWRGGTTWEHDRHAEARAGKRIRTRCDKWENRVVALHDRGISNELVFKGTAPRIELHGDPRGPVLKVQLPGESEAVAV